jgi:hypothetical protein
MENTLKKTITIALLVIACSLAHAAGGTCPTGANYISPSTGSLVTLSSLGVTSCYFVAANGSDSNDGLSEASGHPWLHAPFMPNCTGNCATVTSQSASLWPGIGIIFRGGDTWHFGNSGLTPYVGGTWEWNTGTLPNGTSAHPIYIGVDQSWFSGGSWARPVFNADNSLCNSGTLGTMPDGFTCSTTTDVDNQPNYYVSGCAYQISSTNNFIDESFVYGFIWDNFEMTGLCQSSTGQPAHHDSYFSYGTIQGTTAFEDNYIHGASHLQFQARNGQNCTGLVCTNIWAFFGGASGGVTYGDIETFNVIDFSDSDPVGESLCFGGFWGVSYNVFRYTTNCLPTTLHVFHDNLYEYFFENGHSNVIESADQLGLNAVYNNVFRHVENLLTSGGGVFLWLGPVSPSTTDYIFNNIGYDVGPMEYLNLGGEGITFNQGNYVYFNNTWQINAPQPILRGSVQTAGTTLDTNNHYIDDQNPIQGGSLAITSLTSLCQSNTSGGTTTPCPTYSDANVSTKFDQYTGSQTYAYAPVASTNSTVGVGTNETSGYCATLSASGDALIQAAGTACGKATTYGCSYNATTHANTCPALTAVVRPSSGSWDIGAYQFASGGASTPTFLPGTGTYSSAQTVTISTDSIGAIICYNTVGSPATNGTTGCTTGTLYTGAVTVSSTETLYAVAGGTGFADSSEGSAAYTITGPATLTSPTPGSTFTGPSATFMWTAPAEATSYDLWLGSTGVGSNNLWSSGSRTATFVTFGALPTNGETIYARLWTYFSGVSSHADYTYTADTQSALTSPTPGSTFTGPSATFTWTTASGATQYTLWLGTTGVGSNNLWSSGGTTATSVTFGGLPTNGEIIYARLWTNFNGVSVHSDYTYTAH